VKDDQIREDIAALLELLGLPAINDRVDTVIQSAGLWDHVKQKALARIAALDKSLVRERKKRGWRQTNRKG
jgi:hypothetical protein